MFLQDIVQILVSTPAAMTALLDGLPDHLLHTNEGESTWSPYQVIGHLITGEETDWIARMEIILSKGEDQPFTPFNRTAFREKYSSQAIGELLDLFGSLRKRNLEILASKHLTEADLHKTGMHPALGRVTLRNLLATWAVHDLGHIRQIARTVANQYAGEVGPWREYLSIIGERPKG